MLRLCARETTSGSFIPQVDGLRSLAVLAVVLFHLDDQLGNPAVTGTVDQALTSAVRRGFLGVPIFFAISAFIVGLPFARHWINRTPAVETRGFYLRRLTRLEPPYIVNMLVLWGVGAALGHWALADTGPGLLASMGYQHNQFFGYFSTINSVAWSLEVEFQFYLLAPLLTLGFAVSRRWGRWLLLTLLCGLIIGLRDPEHRRSQLSLLGQFEAFAVGLLVVDIYLTVWQGQLPRKLRWDLAGVLGWVGFFGFSRLADPELRAAVQTPCLLVAMLGSLGGCGWAGCLATAGFSRSVACATAFTCGTSSYSSKRCPAFKRGWDRSPVTPADFCWLQCSCCPWFSRCARLCLSCWKNHLCGATGQTGSPLGFKSSAPKALPPLPPRTGPAPAA